MLAQLFFANVALAQTTNTTVPYCTKGQSCYQGVESTIQAYLCTPTQQSGQKIATTNPNQSITGATTSGNNNAASNDLYNCINRLYRFAIVIASAGAVVMIVIAGYIYMSAEGSSESVDRAKSIITTSITAIVILFVGYIFLKALNPDLIQFHNIQPPSVTPITTSYSEGVSTIEGNLSAGSATGTGTAAQQGQQCLFSNINFCQAQPKDALGHTVTCGASVCNQYSAAISRVAQSVGGAASANVLKAIMYKESGCQINPPAGSGGSYGLMQLQPGTAETFKTACGVSSSVTITPQWLQTPANAEASICMGARYLNSLASSCGNNIDELLAGYSGGAGACAPSANCQGLTGCDGDQMRRWECLYDDNQHTVCNGDNTVLGASSKYNETRNSVMTKLYCIQNPGF